MNSALDVAAARSQSMGRPREDDGDVEKRNGEDSDSKPREPEERHHCAKYDDRRSQ
jgi:hypothetical protein